LLLGLAAWACRSPAGAWSLGLPLAQQGGKPNHSRPNLHTSNERPRPSLPASGTPTRAEYQATALSAESVPPLSFTLGFAFAPKGKTKSAKLELGGPNATNPLKQFEY